MIKICTIVGARPQFIKAAAVSRAVATAQGVEEFLVHTGQHYDDAMSDIFFKELNIPNPKYNLGIGSASHGKQTGQMIEKIEEILIKEQPSCVLVYGDTNSTLAGAIAATKLHIPLAHVEAGLRSFNRRMPEEINRVLTDHCSDLLFVPTDTAVKNLENEGITGEYVIFSGDVMLDIANWTAQILIKNPLLGIDRKSLPERYALATIHRAESTDDTETLGNIVRILREVARDLPIIWPIHPRTQSALERNKLMSNLENIKLISPVGYFQMTDLNIRSEIVITDSGGLQKEAFFHNRPCVTLRTETEWVELVDAGWNFIVPPNSEASVAAKKILQLAQKRDLGRKAGLFGDGASGAKILSALKQYYRA